MKQAIVSAATKKDAEEIMSLIEKGESVLTIPAGAEIRFIKLNRLDPLGAPLAGIAAAGLARSGQADPVPGPRYPRNSLGRQ
jgi:hypothetical protein